ncbi:MAG: flagellar protein FlaR [Pseudomonadota bacterium]
MGERIVILGNAGGGKSRLARGLARRIEAPLIELDMLLWQPGWQRTPETEFRQQHDDLVAGPRGVVDGVASWDSIQHRVARCDTLVLVDLPLWQHYWWAAKRQFMCLFRERPDFVPGCPMLPKTAALARMMWWLHRELRPQFLKLVDRERSLRHVYWLRSAAQCEAFYARYCA